MSEVNGSSSKNWSGLQAYSLAVVCLLAGIACGWLFRGSQSPATAASIAGSGTTAAAAANSQPTPEQMKQMADSAAAPLLDKLKSDPSNAALLASIGNTYYDVHEFSTAINYYEQSLKVEPTNAGVRTDMATAYFYAGDTDTAINEFNKALTYEPNKANTLYNLGMVKWQGKMDVNGAVAAWQKLLDTNPNYDGRQKVQQMIDEARKHAGIKPGTSAKPVS
jgi:cytochrome c-type biogenesis protein CcmH/NrfG